MLTFQLHLITSWNDYFTGNPTNYNSQTYNSRHAPLNESIHISNCLFRSMTSESNGGAFFCSGYSTYLLVESTSFFSCKTSAQNGGAIYFFNTNNAQSVLHEVCGYDCCSTYPSRSYCQFAYMYISNTGSSKNYANYPSITRCMNQISDSHYVLRLGNGKICCPSINMSMNKCPYISGIYCHPYVDSNYVTCSLTYSSFVYNSETISICIQFWMGGANFEIKSCNIPQEHPG
jgi:hypothetical protein